MMKYPFIQRMVWSLRKFPTQACLDFLMESQFWPRQRLADLQLQKLQALIAHAYANVPYYRQVMDERGLRPADFKAVQDLNKLPPLTKDLIRQKAGDLQARNIPDSKTYIAKTGGSTGEPMRIRRGLSDASLHNASYVRGLSWGGLDVMTPRVSLFGGRLGQGRPPGLLPRIWAGMVTPPSLFLPAFELGRHNAAEYCRKIREFGGRHMLAYTSAAYLLAYLAVELGEKVSLDAVFSTAENLPDVWRDVIVKAFGCKVMPYYGCGEINSLGYSCGQGDGYHRCDEHAIIEVEGSQGVGALSGEGPFLLTDLDNFAMPLLRYRNGDAGLVSHEPCACGRGLGRITRLDGRVNDFLLTTDSNRISGAIAAHAFKLVRGVQLFQFIQDSPGQVLVRMVIVKEFDKALEEAKLRDILRRHLGAEADISFEYVQDIERTKAGKARFVINHCISST